MIWARESELLSWPCLHAAEVWDTSVEGTTRGLSSSVPWWLTCCTLPGSLLWTVRNFPAVLSSVLLPVAISLPRRVSYHLFHFKAFRGLSCWPHEAKVWSSLCCYGLSLRGNQELVLQSLLLLRPTASLLNSNTILVQTLTSVGFHWDLWCQSREFALPVTARCASAHCWCNVGTYRLVDRSWLDFSKSILSSNRLFLHV